MKKLGTTLLLAVSLLSITACGKKDNNVAANCNTQYGYQQTGYPNTQCVGQYPGQYYGQSGQYGMCQVQTAQYGCLPQGQCASLGPQYGYHPTANYGQPGCVMGTPVYGSGYQQPYQQYPYSGGGYYGGGYQQPQW